MANFSNSEKSNSHCAGDVEDDGDNKEDTTLLGKYWNDIKTFLFNNQPWWFWGIIIALIFISSFYSEHFNGSFQRRLFFALLIIFTR